MNFTLGSNAYMRLTGDFNVKLGETSALRMNVMKTDADNNGSGSKTDKEGIAPTCASASAPPTSSRSASIT